MKRFTLAAIVAAATAVCTAAAVHAAQAPDYTVTTKTYKLTPPRGTNFPNASGSLTIWIAGPIHDRYYDYYYRATFYVEVSRLAPNRVYDLRFSNDGTGASIWAFTTDADGNGSALPPYSWRFGRPQNVPKEYSVVDFETGVIELSN